jgi:hypothetical protein
MKVYHIVLALIVVGGLCWFIGGKTSKEIVYKQVEKEVIKEVQIEAPVLDRIAGCESQGNRNSKGTHFDKNGQVLMRSNTNRTVDLGKYQINTIWFAKATELGLDLTRENDNKKMAEWIYANRGTGDWSASAKCWK